MKRILAGVTNRNAAWRFLAKSIAVLCAGASAAVAEEEPAGPAADAPPATIVCLHTEYLPFAKDEKSVLPFRLVRELGRQAVLIAARDELGLATRDETLGEPFPKSAADAGIDLDVKVRCFFDETVRIGLAKTSADDEEIDKAISPPEKLPSGYDTYTILLHLTQKLEAMSRGELADKLRDLGFAGQAPAASADNVPPESVKDLLLDMNFVSQFAAVRAAHAAIREKGQSPEWLGVLARGYANLALMTQHHWKSDNEAFGARALLYAERLVQLDPSNAQSLVHRAYTRAIVGLHGAALEDVEQVRKQREQSENSGGVPGWFDLIEPYCKFEREPVLAIGERRDSLRPLAERLSFEQTRAYGDDRWLYSSASRAATACPEEYGIYATMANPGAPLGVGRMGAYYGPAVLNQALPARIAKMSDLPKTVRDAVAGSDEKAAATEKGDEETKAKSEEENPLEGLETPAEAPENASAAIARALVAASADEAERGEPSWSVLGNLIAEEQFVQAAKFLKISENATESSMDEEVDALLKIVKGHRYARHIEAYRVNASRETRRFYGVLGDMQFVDPRGNMTPMLRQAWYAPIADGQFRRGMDSSWTAFCGRNLTLPGMLESYDQLADYWWRGLDPALKRMWAHDFATISPHSPQALRLEIQTAEEKPELDQAAEWEGRAGEDPTAYRRLGGIYAGLEQYADAFRCYETSIGLSPAQQTFVDLANAYRASGQEEMWEPTLERFFEVESMGLEHAQVHQMIARDWIKKGDWEQAEPHALAAAETWSAWGLKLAADVTEALEKWEDSEKWIREMSTSYPTGSGNEWYFWCRRNGRGDVAEARKIAQVYFTAGQMKRTEQGRTLLLVFNILEGNRPAALEDAKYLVKQFENPDVPIQSRPFYQMMLALTARDAQEKELESATLDKLRATVTELGETDADLANVDEFVCRLFGGETPSDEDWAAMEEHLAADAIPVSRRSGRHYIIGRLCELNDDTKHAEAYYKRAKAASHYEGLMSTLAGMRMAESANAAAQ